MNMVKKILALVLVAAAVSLSLAGCKDHKEHPTGDHPSKDTPAQEHPASEHPMSEHPQ